MKKYFDEFVRLPLNKMAKKMSELTYLYHNTEVPEKHYKEQLDRACVELISTHESLQTTLIVAIHKVLLELRKESPSLFYKALFCLLLNVKPEEMDARTYFALDVTSTFVEQNKRLPVLNELVLEKYEKAYLNGPEMLFDDDYDESFMC